MRALQVTASTLSQGHRHTARLFIYEIPMSRLASSSRFPMAFGLISPNAAFDLEVPAMSRWWSGQTFGEPRVTQAYRIAPYSFLLKVAFLAAIFMFVLLLAYLAH